MSDVEYPLITSRQTSHLRAVLRTRGGELGKSIGGALDQSVPPLVPHVAAND